MVNNSKLIEWVKLNYPSMELTESDLSELDFYDMDKFANWMQEDTYHNAMQEVTQLFIQLSNQTICLDDAVERFNNLINTSVVANGS